MANVKTVDLDDMTTTDSGLFGSSGSGSRNVDTSTNANDAHSNEDFPGEELGLQKGSSAASTERSDDDKGPQCALCKQTFERSDKLFDHIRWQHPQTCVLCKQVRVHCSMFISRDDNALPVYPRAI